MVCDSFEKNWGGKPLQPCSFEGAYLYHKTSYSNLCLNSTVLNECVNLITSQQQFQSFNFLEEQL